MIFRAHGRKDLTIEWLGVQMDMTLLDSQLETHLLNPRQFRLVIRGMALGSMPTVGPIEPCVKI